MININDVMQLPGELGAISVLYHRANTLGISAPFLAILPRHFEAFLQRLGETGTSRHHEGRIKGKGPPETQMYITVIW